MPLICELVGVFVGGQRGVLWRGGAGETSGEKISSLYLFYILRVARGSEDFSKELVRREDRKQWFHLLWAWILFILLLTLQSPANTEHRVKMQIICQMCNIWNKMVAWNGIDRFYSC